MDLIGLVVFVILGHRDLVGMERVDKTTLWSEIGEKVWSTDFTKVEVERVIRRSSV